MSLVVYMPVCIYGKACFVCVCVPRYTLYVSRRVVCLCCGSRCFCEYLEVCIPLDVEWVFLFGVHMTRNIACVCEC